MPSKHTKIMLMSVALNHLLILSTAQNVECWFDSVLKVPRRAFETILKPKYY